MAAARKTTRKRPPKTTPLPIWYADDPSLRTRQAAERTRHLAERLRRHEELDPKPTEEELFTSLHTCAYQANRAGDRRYRSPKRARVWYERWAAVREYIVQENLGLVYTMVARFRARETDRDELISEGMFGLTRAADRFNPFRGFRFSTYACNVIARAMMRRGKIQSRYHKLFVLQPVGMFDQIQNDNHDLELYAERLKLALDRNIGHLTDLETAVLAQRFPLGRKNPQTFREIGQGVGLSKERVRQIQNTALTKLRYVLQNDPMLI